MSLGVKFLFIFSLVRRNDDWE